MPQGLQEIVDELSKMMFDMPLSEAQRQRICIACKKPVSFYSIAGARDYEISGLCEPCYDAIVDQRD
jgi:hypothetical protein